MDCSVQVVPNTEHITGDDLLLSQHSTAAPPDTGLMWREGAEVAQPEGRKAAIGLRGRLAGARLAEQVLGRGAEQLAAAAGAQMRGEAADDRHGDALGLAHDQLGRAGDL